MPPHRNPKRTGGPGGRNTGGERGAVAPEAQRKDQDPLTKDDIPTIVQAVLEALPGPSGVVNQGATESSVPPCPNQPSSG